MRSSDWSSDVCSSDLVDGVPFGIGGGAAGQVDQPEIVGNGDPQPDDARALDPGILDHPDHRTATELAAMSPPLELPVSANPQERLTRELDEHLRNVVAHDVQQTRIAGVALDSRIGRRQAPPAASTATPP